MFFGELDSPMTNLQLEPDPGGEPSYKRAKTSYESRIDKIAEVETIEEKFRGNHKDVYTEEQLRCLGHL